MKINVVRILGIKQGMYFHCRNAVSRNAQDSLKALLVKLNIKSARNNYG